jgi:hypothetical protein
MSTILGSLDFNYAPVSSLMADIKNRGGEILYIEKEGLDHQGSNGYFGRQEFIDDYMNCYNYVLNLSNDVKETPSADNELGLSVFPNPATDKISISFDTDNQLAGISINNSLGIEVGRFGNRELTGQSAVDFITKNLPAGIYYCIIQYGMKTFTKSFVIAR